jgi:hypothetical protein
VERPRWYCTNCGAQVSPGDAFCGSCGAPLSPGPENASPPGTSSKKPGNDGSCQRLTAVYSVIDRPHGLCMLLTQKIYCASASMVSNKVGKIRQFCGTPSSSRAAARNPLRTSIAAAIICSSRSVRSSAPSRFNPCLFTSRRSGVRTPSAPLYEAAK